MSWRRFRDSFDQRARDRHQSRVIRAAVRVGPSACFEELVDSLVGQAEELGGIATAESKVSECLDGFDRLLLRSSAGTFGGAADSDDVVGNRRELCRELVADVQLRRGRLEPERDRFADPALGLSDVAPVGLAWTSHSTIAAGASPGRS